MDCVCDGTTIRTSPTTEKTASVSTRCAEGDWLSRIVLILIYHLIFICHISSSTWEDWCRAERCTLRETFDINHCFVQALALSESSTHYEPSGWDVILWWCGESMTRHGVHVAVDNLPCHVTPWLLRHWAPLIFVHPPAIWYHKQIGSAGMALCQMCMY